MFVEPWSEGHLMGDSTQSTCSLQSWTRDKGKQTLIVTPKCTCVGDKWLICINVSRCIPMPEIHHGQDWALSVALRCLHRPQQARNNLWKERVDESFHLFRRRALCAFSSRSSICFIPRAYNSSHELLHLLSCGRLPL